MSSDESPLQNVAYNLGFTVHNSAMEAGEGLKFMTISNNSSHINMMFQTESRPLTYPELEMLLPDTLGNPGQEIIAEVKATICDCRYEGLVTAYVAFSIDKLHIEYVRFPSYQVETDSIKEILEHLISEYCSSVSNARYFDQGFPVPSQLNGSKRIFKGVNGYENGVLFSYTRKK